MSVSVRDVAQYIVEKAGGRIDQMKLQKILYYCQGWSLANDLGTLFDERIEAWANGPVIPQLWDILRDVYIVRFIPEGDSANVPLQQKQFIDEVWKQYSSFSGAALSVLTHGEAPWKTARGRVPEGQRCSNQITPELMQQYFATELERSRAVTA